MSINKPLDMSNTAGHVGFFYKNEQERLELITEYFSEGIANKELCIFVTPHSIEKTKQDFLQHGLDINEALEDGSFHIFEMNSTYLPHGEFVASYMLQNVQSFIDDAKAKGFSGLRTAGEMTWLDDHQEATEEAVLYEQEVNALDTSDFSFIGLCLYASNTTPDELTEGVKRTHPTLFFDSQLMNNPFYAPA